MESQHKYERIDKGVKRPKIQAPDVQPHNARGFAPVVTVEERTRIIAYAIDKLKHGETTDNIGAEFNIDGSTLRRWLLAEEGDKADLARKAYFDGELTELRDDLKTAANVFTLARARETFKATLSLAERRLSKYYGIKQEFTVATQPILNIQIVTAPQQVPAIAQIQHGDEPST